MAAQKHDGVQYQALLMVAEEGARNLRQEMNDLPKDDLESEVDVDGDETENEAEDE